MSTKVARMTRQSEERLLNVLESVAGAVTDDGDPNEAIAKAASEKGVPSGHIHLLVNAYNTGRTTRQRLDHDNVWDKAASFPLADTGDILQRMYPDEIKSASALSRETAVSEDYLVSPIGWVNRLAAAEKQAWARTQELPPLVATPPAPNPTDEAAAWRRKEREVGQLTKAASEARYRTSYALDLTRDLTGELQAYFKTAKAAPYVEVRDNCLRLHGDAVQPIFTYLEAEQPELAQKRASRITGPAKGHAYDLVERCLEAGEVFQALRDDYHEKQAAADQAESALYAGAQRPRARHPILGHELQDEETKEAEGKGLFTNMIAKPMGILGNYQDSIHKAQGAELAKQMVKQPKPDPNLDAEMKNIQRKSVIQDLLSGDDVVAGHDPHEVLSAYKDIADVAPISSQKPAIVRDFVRRRLASGQLSYFDIEALTRIEKNLQPPQNKKSPFEE